jgi:hypothetical protein
MVGPAMNLLRATKHFPYNNRRLLPGDTFEANDRDARLLLAVRKAERVRKPVDLPPPPPDVAAKIVDAVGKPEDALQRLRAEYEAVLGKRPYYGWDAAALTEKINAAKAAPEG